MEKSDVYAALSILSILTALLGWLPDPNYTPDYKTGRPTISQDECPCESIIQPTGVEHDQPVVSMKSLTDFSNNTRGKWHSKIVSRSSAGNAGTYQSIEHQFRG